MRVEKTQDSWAVRVDFDARNDWEQWFFLGSDTHTDSKECDTRLLKKHLELAKERNAPIMLFGDVFDAMGAKHDPRTHASDLRDEDVVKDYFDKLVEDTADFYRDNDVVFVSPGNHEENVLKRHHTNLTKRLARELGAAHGKWGGFIRFMFQRADGRCRQSVRMYYTHGKRTGGNSPVTKGVIDTNRRGVSVDADIMVSGHNHNRWLMELTRRGVNDSGKLYVKPQAHINLGTYKKMGEWEEEMGFDAPNQGGAWLRFFHERNGPNREQEIMYQVILA